MEARKIKNRRKVNVSKWFNFYYKCQPIVIFTQKPLGMVEFVNDEIPF